MSRIIRSWASGVPAPEKLAATRAAMVGAGSRYPLHPGVIIEQEELAGVRCLMVTPPAYRGSLLYFHGGGFRLGSPDISAGFASHVAAGSGCRFIIPYYGLSPESPFPNALLEGQAVLEFLADQDDLLVGGDSAGGNLAAVLTCHHADRVRALLLLSPWLDLRLTAASYHHNRESDTLFSRAAATEAIVLYLGDTDATDPDVSPLLADLSSMPATLLTVGSGEVLFDDSLDFARRLMAARRQVAVHVFPDMMHVEATLNHHSPAARQVLAHASLFVATHCDAVEKL